MLEIDIFVSYKLGSDDVIRFPTTMAKRDIQIHGNYFSCHIGQGHFPFNQKRKGKSNVTEIFPKKFPKNWNSRKCCPNFWKFKLEFLVEWKEPRVLQPVSITQQTCTMLTIARKDQFTWISNNGTYFFAHSAN